MLKPIKRYRPERHYMRGPGPKWFEKHGGGISRVGAAMDDHSRDKTSTSGLLFPSDALLARVGWVRQA